MSTVIKQRDSLRSAPGVAFNLDDVSAQARQYLEAVRHEAAKLVARAQAEAEQVRRRAEAEGLAAAQRKIDELVDQRLVERLRGALPALDAAVREIQKSRHAWLAQWERSAVDLAARMAERVVRRELQSDPQVRETLVREALELAAGSPEVRLHVNPADHEALARFAAELARTCARLAPTEVVPDPTVSPGGCRVETRFGAIDQTVEAQLERLAEELI